MDKNKIKVILENLIFEDFMGDFTNKFVGDGVLKNKKGEVVGNKITKATFNKIKDISKKAQYAVWLTKHVVFGSVLEEDIYKFNISEPGGYLNTFENFKDQFEYNDINKYFNKKDKDKTIMLANKFKEEATNIYNATIDYSQSEDAEYHVSPRDILKLKNAGIELVGTVSSDGLDYQCFKVPQGKTDEQTFKAYSNILGKCAGRDQGAKIEICTMADKQYFDSYLKDDDYYVFFNLKDRKSPYQFHYDSNQFMDKDDVSLI